MIDKKIGAVAVGSILPPGVQTTQQQSESNPRWRTGKEYPETITHDDSKLYTFDDFTKIAKIRLFHNTKYLFGIEIVYTNLQTKALQSSGRHLDPRADLLAEHVLPYMYTETSLELANDEYIIEISGRSASWLDQLAFKTTKGQHVSAGGRGGEAFIFTAPPGFHFRTLITGIGKHIDFVETKPSRFPSINGTLGFNQLVIPQDVGERRLQFASAAPISFDEEPYFHSDDNTPPNKPKNQTKKGATAGGVGYMRTSSILGSPIAGTPFDDAREILGDVTQPIITELDIQYDDIGIVGLLVKYEGPLKQITGTPHLGTAVNPATHSKEIKLIEGEFITEISGRAKDEAIVYLRLSTNKGQTHMIGKEDQSGPLVNFVTRDLGVVRAFAGATAHHLTRLYAYTSHE